MMQVLRIGAAIVGLTALLVGAGAAARADYALQDNDTVVFLGDRNTAGSIFVKTVENYTPVASTAYNYVTRRVN